jgi:hypothetical protein
MQFVQTEGTLRGMRLKQTPRSLILIKEDVPSLSAAQDLLLLILEKVEKLETGAGVEEA